MNFHKNSNIQKLIEDIDEQYNQGNINKFLELNQTLLDYGRANNDNCAMYIAQYNRCSKLFLENNFEASTKELLLLLPKLKEENLTLFVLRSYNELGIIESEQANYYTSLNYYIEALRIAKKHPETKFLTIIYNNIGNLFVWLEENKAALPYLKQAFAYYESEQLDRRVIAATILINIVECYSCLKEYDNAQNWYATPFNFEANEKRVIDNIMLCNQAEIAYNNKNEQAIESIIKKIIYNTTFDTEYIYHFRSFLRIFEIAIKINNKHLCDEILEQMKRMNNDMIISTFRQDFNNLKVQYHQKFIQTDHLKPSDLLLKEHVNQSNKMIKQLKQVYTQSLLLQLELENVEQQKQTLEKNLELDEFTNILNKISFQNKVETILFSKKEYKPALLIIDIDHFKTINDTYGHDFGDTILLKVANMIKQKENHNILVGRFGGDEFILCIPHCEQQKVAIDLATQLIKEAHSIKFIDETKHLTYSIGIAFSNSTCDFESLFKKADTALYSSKKNGRDSYFVYQENSM